MFHGGTVLSLKHHKEIAMGFFSSKPKNDNKNTETNAKKKAEQENLKRQQNERIERDRLLEIDRLDRDRTAENHRMDRERDELIRREEDIERRRRESQY